MGATLAATLRLDAMDLVLVTGPLALAMILVEMVSYWRCGRRPAAAGARASVALAVGGPAMVGSLALMGLWRPSALLIIGAMLLLWVGHSYGRTTSPLSRASRAVLVALRAAIIVLLLVYLLKPTLYSIVHRYRKAALLVLYDTSRSMTIADAGSDGRARRIDVLRSAIERNKDRIADLSQSFDVFQFAFDDRDGEQWIARVSDADKSLAEPPSLETTAVGKAVNAACNEVGSQTIGGVIVFTDGADNAMPADEPLRVARDLGGRSSPVPIWPVGVGAEKPPADRPVAVLKEMTLSDRKLAVFNVLEVHAVYELINLPGQPVAVELVFGQGAEARVADRKVITAADGRTSESVSVDLKVTPTTAGFHAVTVRVAEDASAKDGTALAGQFAQRTDYVQVDDEDLLQVLYVEGKYRHEAHFIIQAIAGSNLARLNRQFKLSSPALGGEASSQWPTGEAEWKKYHVVILGDVRADAFTADELKTIRTMVQDMGKGLMMLGGRDTFGQGGWPDSPLAGLFPFDLRQAVGHLAEPFKLQATPQGLEHPLMQLEEKADDNARAWSELPPMQGANRLPDAQTILREHAGAIILARTPAGQPVMVVQESGKGRVLAMAIDTTWRWRMHLDVDKGAKWHDHFWRQAVVWLAKRDTRAWVRCDQPRYRLLPVRGSDGREQRVVRDKIAVTASIVDQAGKPVGAAARPRLTFIRPDGKADEAIDLAPYFKGDLFRLDLPRPPTGGGDHKLVLEGVYDGKNIREETRFLVETIDLELAPPRLANYPLLRQMAETTRPAGGQFFTLDQLDKLLDKLQSSDYLESYDVEDKSDLGRDYRWHLLAAILVLLMAEWMVRKRKSLV